MKKLCYVLGVCVIILSIIFASGECETVLQQILLELTCLASGFGGYLLCKWGEE